MLETFIGAAIILFLIVFLVFIIDFFMSWFDSSKDRPRIKFDEFLDLYSKNKYRWYLCEHCVEYREPRDPNSRIFRDNYKSYFIGFGFFDYMRYRYWHENHKRIEEKEKMKKENEEIYRVLYKED